MLGSLHIYALSPRTVDLWGLPTVTASGGADLGSDGDLISGKVAVGGSCESVRR